MSPEEKLQALKQENQELRARQTEVSEALLQMSQCVAELEARQSKGGLNSHWLPSSDRFVRQKKTRSRHTSSGKKPGGQAGQDMMERIWRHGHRLTRSSCTRCRCVCSAWTFVAFVAISPPFVSNDFLCFRLCSTLWLAIHSSPLFQVDLNSY